MRENNTATKGTEWNGYHLLPMFETVTAKFAYNIFSPKPGDVLLATCGKTDRLSTRRQGHTQKGKLG